MTMTWMDCRLTGAPKASAKGSKKKSSCPGVGKKYEEILDRSFKTIMNLSYPIST